MIKQVRDSKTFLDIVDKLDDTDCKLSKKSLYSFMIAGEYNKQTFTYASYNDTNNDTNNNKMTGCEVTTLNNALNGDLTLTVVFLWIDPHYRKLWKNYLKYTELRAKEFKCKKISFTTSRSEEAIKRQMGKYGYKKAYNVIEKEMI